VVRDDDNQALEDYSEAIRLNPDYLQAYYNRGFVRGNLGDFASAIEDYTQILQRQPDHPQARNMRLDMAEWRRRR
jgi:tetratricopeptide (TPR) repeat protein